MRIPIWFSLIHASFVSNTNIVNIDLELENFSQFFYFFSLVFYCFNIKK
jgi:hypothetical protein